MTRWDGIASSSSRGIDSETVTPRGPERVGVGVDGVVAAGAESDRVISRRDAAACCSVHAEMAMACCGDRWPWEPSGRRRGWIAIMYAI